MSGIYTLSGKIFGFVHNGGGVNWFCKLSGEKTLDTAPHYSKPKIYLPLLQGNKKCHGSRSYLMCNHHCFFFSCPIITIFTISVLKSDFYRFLEKTV